MGNIPVEVQMDDVSSELERREMPLRQGEGNPVANAFATVRGIGLFVPLMLTMWLGIYFVIEFIRL